VKTKLLPFEFILEADIGWKGFDSVCRRSYSRRQFYFSLILLLGRFANDALLTTFFVSSGLVYGRWVTWRDLAIQLRPMGRGLIRMFLLYYSF